MNKTGMTIMKESTFNLLTFLFFLALIIGTSKLITYQSEDLQLDNKSGKLVSK